MINAIKSFIILKKILLNLGQLRKLYLFQYNKRIQKILNINIIDYQLLSKEYIIGEKNGICEQYTIINNKLSFKGEYKNGKRNGKGTCYYYNNDGYMIYGSSSYGPLWGNGDDLYMASGCLNNTTSTTKQNSFDYKGKSNALSGGTNFQAEDYETYQLILE